MKLSSIMAATVFSVSLVGCDGQGNDNNQPVSSPKPPMDRPHISGTNTQGENLVLLAIMMAQSAQQRSSVPATEPPQP